MEFAELVEIEDSYELSDEDLHDHWNAPGGIIFRVDQNIIGKNCDDIMDTFEIEVLDSWGCAGGLDEGMGIDYCIEHYWGLRPELKEGVTYTLHNVNVEWYRGDGWEIDDDVEYYYDDMTADYKFWERAKIVLFNLWWQNIGWRVRTWRNRK